MKRRHAIFELPKQNEFFDKLISDEQNEVQSINFSSTVMDGEVKHFAMVVWHGFEYGEHMW